jgi:hypothetical protein
MKSTSSEYLKVTERHLDIFRDIIKKYKNRTYFEKKDRWGGVGSDQDNHLILKINGKLTRYFFSLEQHF